MAEFKRFISFLSSARDECRALKSVSPRTPPDTVRLIARLVWRLRAGGGREAPHLPAGPDGTKGQRSFEDLMTHSKDVRKDQERMEAFDAYFAVLTQFLGKNCSCSSVI